MVIGLGEWVKDLFAVHPFDFTLIVQFVVVKGCCAIHGGRMLICNSEA
jgi:hypothetical protein